LAANRRRLQGRSPPQNAMPGPVIARHPATPPSPSTRAADEAMPMRIEKAVARSSATILSSVSVPSTEDAMPRQECQPGTRQGSTNLPSPVRERVRDGCDRSPRTASSPSPLPPLPSPSPPIPRPFATPAAHVPEPATGPGPVPLDDRARIVELVERLVERELRERGEPARSRGPVPVPVPPKPPPKSPKPRKPPPPPLESDDSDGYDTEEMAELARSLCYREPEMRVAADGVLYTKREFEDYFEDGGVQWEMALPCDPAMEFGNCEIRSESEESEPELEHEPERRVAADGVSYTRAEFDEYFQDDGAAWRAVPLPEEATAELDAALDVCYVDFDPEPDHEPEPEHEPERRAAPDGLSYTRAEFDAYFQDDGAAWRAVPLPDEATAEPDAALDVCYADFDPDDLEDTDPPPPPTDTLPPLIEMRRPAGQGAKARRAAARAATFGM
jgi:hypothetical protein